MRPRHVALLALLSVANFGILATLGMWALADRLVPLPPPITVTALIPAAAPTVAAARSAPPTAPQPPVPTVPGEETTRLAVQPEALATAAALAAITAAPAASPAALAEDAGDLPASASVAGVTGHRQSRPLSCESRSAADWAAFFGIHIDELEFLERLPASDDPDRGFVGDVHGAWGQLPPGPYGVHAGPVARLLADYGVPAEAGRYLKWEAVQREIALGRPVIAWVVGHVEAGEGEVYTARDGRQTIVARREHTVIVTGYTPETVTVVDGARVFDVALEQFLESWGALRNMAVMTER
jgi:uncharacterized protein YvpB